MATINDIVFVSALPIVDLNNIDMPSDGIYVGVNNSCKKNYIKSDICRKYYDGLSKLTYNKLELYQCPYGFTSTVVKNKDLIIALTGFIPFPRGGGLKERAMAKQHPESKISSNTMNRSIKSIDHVTELLSTIEKEAITNYSMALHEIRKLNRGVKQTAERICNRENPSDPDAATPELVHIWKSSELMSKQFDIIEILANESLTQLPVNREIEVYRIFDKCVRIYQPPGKVRRIRIGAPAGYSPKIAACDKTFPIIPTVLIENALKYSKDASGISVTIAPKNGKCLVKVSNTTKTKNILDDSIFKRGVRSSSEQEGTGNGLYVAQIVAKQHGTNIQLQSEVDGDGTITCSFSILFKIIS